MIENQYDLVYGSWPTEYDEIVLVLDENNEIDDMEEIAKPTVEISFFPNFFASFPTKKIITAKGRYLAIVCKEM